MNFANASMKPPMSALPPKADMAQHDCDVRFVPKADIETLSRFSSISSTGANPTRAHVQKS
jgi:hypothetical protein